MTVKPLSQKQERIINFVTEFLHDKGYPPTVRDIAAGCGLSSTSAVAYNLNKPQQAGYIPRHSDISRGIEFLASHWGGRETCPYSHSSGYVEIQGRVVAVIRRIP